MTNPNTRKQKVELADYSYQRDISHRQFLSQLTEFEIFATEEIVNGSLKTTVDQLATILETTNSNLQPLLTRLANTDLLKLDKQTVVVNKEIRKYYCCELAKFGTCFEPDLQHLQALLHKVPIHILPLWYAIPRNSDNIFQSIVERYFQTPRAYQKHLEELALENPVLFALFEMLQTKPDFSLPASVIMEKWQLSPQEFHELALSFEYHLGGCLCYRREGNSWQAYLTLYHEWQQYLSFLRLNAPGLIKDEPNIQRHHPHDFGCIEDLANLVRLTLDTPKALEATPLQQKGDDNHPLQQHWHHISAAAFQAYLADLYRFASHLHLLSIVDGYICPHVEEAKLWLKKHKQDQASDIYCLVLTATRQSPKRTIGCSEREFREIEKALKRVAHSGWIYFDDFVKGTTASIGQHAPVSLLQKGKKWRYALPSYNSQEKQLLQDTVFKDFFYTCFVATGSHQGRPCFYVTPYGRMSLGD
jgi:predicted transcriptional regulator